MNINTKITGTQRVEVELDFNDIKNLTIRFLCDQFNWKTSYILKEENGETRVLEDKEFYSSHSFTSRQKVRVATESDIIISKVINEILKK
jgi:hypothetical protein